MMNMLQSLPPEILTASLGALPLTELRGAIPVALLVYKMPVFSAFSFAVLGNLIPALFLLLGLESVSSYLSRRSALLNRFFVWLFERTRRIHGKKFQTWQGLALVFLVALPVPLTGAWTGSLCAFVFGIPWKKAFLLITTGVIIAGLIVTFTTMGIVKII